MKRLLAWLTGFLLLLGVATASHAMWVEENVWVDEDLMILKCEDHAHVYQLAFDGRIYLEDWTLEELNQYLEYWYYLHSI